MERKDAEKLEMKKPCSIPTCEKELQNAEEFIKDYRRFIDNAKTERLAVTYTEGEAMAKGFKPYTYGQKLKTGDKITIANINLIFDNKQGK